MITELQMEQSWLIADTAERFARMTAEERTAVLEKIEDLYPNLLDAIDADVNVICRERK